MIGNIVLPNGIKRGNPLDDYFDPITHTATEANFIRFLEAGIYTSDVIGYKVILSNSIDYNNGIWIIADVNHDSINTGQTNCYDLISEKSFSYGRYPNTTTYRNGNIRSWLVNTFYPGFSANIKSHVLNIKYYSNGSWYSDDNIVLISHIETGGTETDVIEGVKYPIFTDNASRIKYSFTDGAVHWWWTRTRGTQWVMPCVTDTGGYDAAGYDWATLGTVPIIRIH